MLVFSLTFLVIAVIASIFGFGGTVGAGIATLIAKGVFFIFIVLLAISLTINAIRCKADEARISY
ncbi:DUF1328 domain-containing protein [Pseudocolwellia sp. HL-MZ19]|uniref:DUF1328 domain-containing protein n=1 Tax=unclassified Pseudocolwellia TaxID=2848178 RepID=UPI003CF56F0D